MHRVEGRSSIVGVRRGKIGVRSPSCKVRSPRLAVYYNSHFITLASSPIGPILLEVALSALKSARQINARALFRLGCPSILSKTITLRCYEALSFYLHLAEYIRHFHVRWQTGAVESTALLFLIAQNTTKSFVPTFRHFDSLTLTFAGADYVVPTFLSALYAHHGVHHFPPAVGPPRSAQPRAPRHRQIHIHGGKIGLFSGAGVGTERTERTEQSWTKKWVPSLVKTR